MRVNVYAEEMTRKVQIISKGKFTGLRFSLELPATVKGKQYKGPFMHSPDDDDSSAVTFWGKRDLRIVLRIVLRKALRLLDRHYAKRKKRKPVNRMFGDGISLGAQRAMRDLHR